MPYIIVVKIIILIFSLLLVVVSHSAIATERIDFRVNDDNSTAIQNSPRIAVAIDQSFAVTWVDRRNGVGDIYIQKFNRFGYSDGANQKINDDTNSSYQFDPAIAVELSGRFSLVWKDYRTGSYPFNPEIFSQRYDSTFTLLGDNEQVTTEAPLTTRETPDISLSDSKKAIIVWADYRNSNWDIYGQLVAADGSSIGVNFKVNDDLANAQQHRPRVSVSSQGWFVVTWYDNRLGSDDVFVQVFDSAGTAIGTNTLVNEDVEDARQAFPDVTTDGAGNFTVVWVDWRNGIYPSNPDIYSRKYTSAMVAVTDEININTDSSSTAQREPAISADRLGNVAIVWADSNSNSWDISGQMIDVDGIIRDSNFIANTNTDSAQVSPDVAIDGKQRYVTWVDRRNGNYDIYASIQEYNDPNLAVSEISIQFTMQVGDAAPSAQTIIVDHLGYNPLGFSITSDMDWLDVTPLNSTTTDTVSLLVNTDTLPVGTYTGTLRFSDDTYFDSSLTVPVRLQVYYPTMYIAEDTLSFVFFENIVDTSTETITVENVTYGSFSWSASESATWMTASSYTGFSDDSIVITVEPSSLVEGTYLDYIVFTSADANGSPDTLFVEIEVINNLPYLVATPDSIFLYTDSILNYTLPIEISNFGADSLVWNATKSSSWFTIDTSNGVDGDTLTISIDSVGYGRYTGYIDIVDTNAYNNAIQVPVILDYYQPSTDTLTFTNTNTATEQTVSISLTLDATNNLTEFHLPFQFDTTYIILDSITEGVTSPEITSLAYTLNNTNGSAIINITMSQADTFLNTGSSHLAELYFTSKSVLGLSAIDSMITDSITTYALDSGGVRYAPQVVSGSIDVDVATDIDDNILSTLPDKIELSQNYPNPFNLSTTISYSLPSNSDVALNVYNILGQKIRELLLLTQAAGNYNVDWNGRYNDGRIAPSGIYFYRLEANSLVFVKKMVLLK